MKINMLYLISLVACSCNSIQKHDSFDYKSTSIPANVLNYAGTPESSGTRDFLAYSDQGAWFAYSFPDESSFYGGFSGPFLMTQDNGIWCSKSLSVLQLYDNQLNEEIDFASFASAQTSYNSHLLHTLENEDYKIEKVLFFADSFTALQKYRITNKKTNKVSFKPVIKGGLIDSSLKFIRNQENISIVSLKSKTKGYLQIHSNIENLIVEELTYQATLKDIEIEPNTSIEIIVSQIFTLPEYNFNEISEKASESAKSFDKLLEQRITEKEEQLIGLNSKIYKDFNDSIYKVLLTKAVLTLQNNWRIYTGELKHDGLFPSYHYEWFHGFWAWDSWKHAVALAYIDINLAKDQIRAMYDYQQQDGFIPDCIFRDTTIEKHNYRNTKAPLSGWAIWKVFENSNDTSFLREMYPKLKLQHSWWYRFRDIDKDSLCEYGSTDGTIVAAKWESGMDNAVRFDNSKIIRCSESAFSLNQESVDLNSYLYAEKNYLSKMAKVLNKRNEAKEYETECSILKTKIQNQFYNPATSWFYDISVDGAYFIDAMGCEGWIPLWAEVATEDQAQAVMKNMMDEDKFNTFIPLQTLAANHPLFKPERGYWRGPNWIDQSYFGIMGLKKYGFNKEADSLANKLIHNAKGLVNKGSSIRENYNPITGEGLEAHNFSWSAAHYLLLLINE